MKTVGFISAPDWLDPTPEEFRQLTNGAIPVQQTFLDPPGFDYRIESFAQSEPRLIHAARQLRGANCTLIASPGTPFGFVGYDNISEARAGLTRISQECDAVCISSASAIVDTLEAWQVSRVALACVYYPDDWRDLWAAFIENSGFDVLGAASLVDQGFRPPSYDGVFNYPNQSEIRAAVAKMVADYPQADAIVVSGSGARTLALTQEWQTKYGNRVIAADTSLYRSILSKLGIEAPMPLSPAVTI